MSTLEVYEKKDNSYLGVDINIAKDIFKCNLGIISCIYLISLNEVRFLRESMHISAEVNDDYIICKYGYTEDIYRRICEHISTYNKIKGCSLKLKFYSYIDPRYLSRAETDIREFIKFGKFQLIYKDTKELIAIPRETFKIFEILHHKNWRDWNSICDKWYSNIKLWPCLVFILSRSYSC